MSAVCLYDLELTTRTENMLRAEGIHTLDDLLKKSAVDLLKGEMFGRKSLAEVEAKLAARGLTLRDTVRGYTMGNLKSENASLRAELKALRRDSLALAAPKLFEALCAVRDTETLCRENGEAHISDGRLAEIDAAIAKATQP